MCTMMINNELNGVELYFESKPLQNIIDSLKELKFRWNRSKGCWYAKQNDTTLKLAQELTTGEADTINNAELASTTTKTNKNEQKRLKEMFKQILISDVWGNDEKMVNHCLKASDYIVELENGDIISLDKPKIETSFCFGYSDSHYNTDDYDRANQQAEAAKSEDYFLKQNLEGITKTINRLENLDSFTKIYTSLHYCGQPDESKLKCYTSFKDYSFNDMTDKEKEKYTLLGAGDVQKIIEGYKIVKSNFEKRLQTYLKKYGTSKLQTWSYWQDA